MPVARDHLCRKRIGHEPEPVARDTLDLGVDAPHTCRPSPRLADTAAFECTLEPLAVAVEASNAQPA